MIVAMEEFAPAGAAAPPANENGGSQDAELRSWSPEARRPRAARPSKPRPVEQPSSPPNPHLETGLSEVAILDAAGCILAINEAWRRAAAGQALADNEAGVGAFYVDAAARLLPGLDRPGLEQGMQRLLSGAADDARLARDVPTVSGSSWRRLQITPLALGDTARFVAIHTDQIELATTREALKATAEQLLSAKDDERRSIAMELHDSTCQHLVAIGFGLMRLRRTLPGAGDVILDEITHSLDEAIKETRVLSYLMKPRGLDPRGLATTLLQFLEGFARRTGLEVSLKAAGSVDSASPPLQHATLRIVQEALLNVNRHAGARRVTVELSVDDSLLTVSIADDGRGMGPAHADPCLGVGIPGMRARAHQFLGDLAITSDETGTRIVALLPLS
jgi:two-component system NarL family sensor kinase